MNAARDYLDAIVWRQWARKLTGDRDATDDELRAKIAALVRGR